MDVQMLIQKMTDDLKASLEALIIWKSDPIPKVFVRSLRRHLGFEGSIEASGQIATIR